MMMLLLLLLLLPVSTNSKGFESLTSRPVPSRHVAGDVAGVVAVVVAAAVVAADGVLLSQ